ncbi:MAG: metalloregulator ArsR/SmtB family transcription factor [Halothiobacillus sp.]
MNTADLHQHPEQLFTVLSDETRLRILLLLEAEPRLCVCHLQQLLDKPQSTVSRHIGILVADEWLESSQKGTANLYALNPALPLWVREILRLARMSWSLSAEGFAVLKEAHQLYLDNHALLANGADSDDEVTNPATPAKIINVLFLCVANSARSILAEALLNRWGRGRFVAYSAGQNAAAAVHPYTVEALKRLDLPTDGAQAKHWSVFLAPDAPPMDLVITVCDTLLGEACPAWPGRPITAHWGVPDPVKQMHEHPEADPVAFFVAAGRTLETRVRLLTQLPDYAIEKIRIRDEIQAIGLIND